MSAYFLQCSPLPQDSVQDLDRWRFDVDRALPQTQWVTVPNFLVGDINHCAGL